MSDRGLGRLRTIVLAGLVFSGALVGIWAEAAPQDFHARFPGFGREWVAPLGPYNEHLVRDVGGLHLALAAVAGYALLRGSANAIRAAGLAWLTWGALHLAYHATMTEMFGAVDNALQLGSLAAIAAVATLLALRPGRLA